uniref:Uncharacterized protein n=1 Tax=uncultured Elusimicrobia bacterium TaxID=699876 RepID=A0A650EPJ0_9BACT|nr:hypothetical protein Elusimicrob2101_0770 [uncultured Elusimicrobia bacterium]
MNPETLLEQISAACDALRSDTITATRALLEFNRRLEQILQQLHKNIDVRDTEFAPQFNDFCARLRKEQDDREPFWTEARATARNFKPADWTGDLALPAKGLNSRAKTLSRATDEFTTAYDLFCRNYKSFTAAKLNVWLLTSCQNDYSNLTGKILFLAREIAKHTEKNRGPHAFG